MLLNEDDRQILIDIFASMNTDIEVWAYGSRVTGNAHAGSDLDLVLRTQDLSPLDISEFRSLCEKIKHSNVVMLVEMRDWAKLPDYFHQNIEEDYEVLYP